MISQFMLTCRIVKAPVFDNNNCWLLVSSAAETPSHVDPATGQNRYDSEIINILIAPIRVKYLMDNCYVGQMIHLTGDIKGRNNLPLLEANQLYCITDKSGNFKK